MSHHDLSSLVPGFDHEALGSQAVFRAALHALAHPGRPTDMPMGASAPQKGHMAAAVLLLGLLDADNRLWLSESLAHSDAAGWLRFHTGCALVPTPEQADFCWCAQGDVWPNLAALPQGSDDWPERSATCVLEVTRLLADGTGWALQGPGIDGTQRLRVQGMADGFEAQWQANQTRFPCGVDVFLATATQIAGLPRSTQLLPTPGA